MPQDHSLEAEKIDAVVELLGVPIAEGASMQALTLVMHGIADDGVRGSQVMLLASPGSDWEPVDQMNSALQGLAVTYNGVIAAQGDSCANGQADEEYWASLHEHAERHGLGLVLDEESGLWTVTVADGRQVVATDGMVLEVIHHFGCAGRTDWPPTELVDHPDDFETDLEEVIDVCEDVLRDLAKYDDDTNVQIGRWFEHLTREDPAFATMCFLHLAGRLIGQSRARHKRHR